jgi:hypothetical protein
MEKIFLGIDNGLDGGLVALNASGDIVAMTIMPTRKEKRLVMVKKEMKEKTRRLVEEMDLLEWIKDLQKLGSITVCLERPTFAKDYKAAVSMADSFATCRTVIKLLGLPYSEVDPKEWQPCFWKRPKDAKDTGWTTKKQAWRVAQNNWAGHTFLASKRCSVPHDGMVDACLIAEYRRRFC